MGCGTSKPPASAELADNAKPDDTEAALPADQQRSDAPEDPFAPTLSDAEKRLVDVQPRLESAEVVDPAFRTNWAEGIPPPTAGPDPTASALVRGLASISNTTPSYARLKRLHDNVLALLIFALDIRLCVEVLFEGSGDFAFDTICALLLGATLQWWWTGEYMGSWTTLGYTTGWEMVGQMLVYGPFGIPFLDLICLLHTLNLAHHLNRLPSPDFFKLPTLPTLEGRGFFGSYPPSRLMALALGECVPVLVLRLWMPIKSWFKAGGVTHDYDVADWLALALQLYCVLLCAYRIFRGSLAAQLSPLEYFQLGVYDMGARIPVLAFHTNTLSTYELAYQPPAAKRRVLALAIAPNRSLVSVRLAGTKMGSEEAEQLAVLVVGSTTLRELDVSDCIVDERGALAINEALKANYTLEVLSLKDNDITEPTKAILRDTWAHASKPAPKGLVKLQIKKAATEGDSEHASANERPQENLLL